jgi:hypothetical protein
MNCDIYDEQNARHSFNGLAEHSASRPGQTGERNEKRLRPSDRLSVCWMLPNDFRRTFTRPCSSACSSPEIVTTRSSTEISTSSFFMPGSSTLVTCSLSSLATSTGPSRERDVFGFDRPSKKRKPAAKKAIMHLFLFAEWIPPNWNVERIPFD